jgi:protein tyrosine/serine phosphatase
MRSLADNIYNFHWIVRGEAARSSQAYAGFLAPFLRRHRIRSVINLRGQNPQFAWWRYEKEICTRLNVEHINVRVNSRTLPARELLIDLLSAFDTSKRPILIKCSGGQDRTSFAAALYIIHRNGWSAYAQAIDQFRGWPYLHWPKRNQRWAKLFLAYAKNQAEAQSLHHWLQHAYTPEHFMAWLDNEGASDSFRNLPGQPPRIRGSGC